MQGGFSHKTGTLNKEISTNDRIYQLNKRHNYHITIIHKIISVIVPLGEVTRKNGSHYTQVERSCYLSKESSLNIPFPPKMGVDLGINFTRQENGMQEFRFEAKNSGM